MTKIKSGETGVFAVSPAFPALLGGDPELRRVAELGLGRRHARAKLDLDADVAHGHLGAGLSQVAGKLFRIGHLGDLNELMLLGAISGAEMAMCDVGIEVVPGSGVAAAQEQFRAGQSTKETRIAAE